MNGDTPIRQVGWCRSGRHRITGDLDIKRWSSPDGLIREMCRHCFREADLKSARKRRAAKFSDAPPKQWVCVACGAQFPTRNPHAGGHYKYCSHDCRLVARREQEARRG